MNTNSVVFNGRRMTFESFVSNLASMLVPQIVKAIKSPPKERISQNEAFRRYGKGNVCRWVREGDVSPASVRPGKKEYLVAELEKLYNKEQDYFTS